eukprot:Hpha_TRINITY_DN9301_c0_g1::TRINITY_DN9301_c0_g1_i1::g.25926::m.25926/K10085/EDEM2; ER degradation enhancer, mannosidase alpha-like 2
MVLWCIVVLLLYTPFAKAAGVWEEELRALEGECRQLQQEGYLYSWCHRDKVLQYHSSKPVLLGAFQGAQPGSATKHLFTKGDTCQQGSREAVVEFTCCHSDWEEASNIEEEEEEEDEGEGKQSGESVLLRRIAALVKSGEAKLPKELEAAVRGHASEKAQAGEERRKRKRVENIAKMTQLSQVEETSACKYHLTVCTPIVCGFFRGKRTGAMPQDMIEGLRDEARRMFYHAYNGYMEHAYPAAELRPVSCKGGDFSLVNVSGVTLIDALDALAVMGDKAEFRRAVELVIKTTNFDLDVNVSVFEATIRLLGGLLSAHVLCKWTPIGEGWGYDDGLLRLAHDLGGRLLAAFPPTGQLTGIPYGTVNLRFGVPREETQVASVAGAGSLTLEFSVLSALTGDPSFAYAANFAARRLYELKSPLGLVGKHIHIGTGEWTETGSNIGTNADSYYEYLLKMDMLFGDDNSWSMFEHLYESVMAFQAQGDWYAEVQMANGAQVRARAEGLYAFWPGLQTLIGEHSSATHTLNALMSIWRRMGFLPEAYEYKRKSVGSSGNDMAYLLRPELVESLLYVRSASQDPSWLWAGREVLMSLQRYCVTPCGYATVPDVGNLSAPREDLMPSFLISETLKYLYLLFDDALTEGGHWLMRGGNTTADQGGWVFTTEAHPFPIGLFRNSVPEIARATAARGLRSRPRPARECTPPVNEWVSSYDPDYVPYDGPEGLKGPEDTNSAQQNALLQLLQNGGMI